MIKFRHDIFIILIITLWLLTAQARYYPPESILRGRNAEVSTVLSGSPKLFAGDYPKAVIPIGNPAVETLLRDNPKPFLLAVILEISITPHGNRKSTPHDDSLKLLAILREYTKLLRVHEHSESDNNLVPTSDINKYTIKDKDLQEIFNRMVETVANVNHERILSLKKLSELENYLPQVSRTTQQKNPLIVIFMQTPNYESNYDNLNINHLTDDAQNVKKTHKKPTIFKEITEGSYFNHNEDDDNVSKSQESDESPTAKNLYLRGWNGCKKSASKYCQKACKKAFKDLCYDYKCSKGFKKDGKKECKAKCNDEFIGSDDYDSESSSSE